MPETHNHARLRALRRPPARILAAAALVALGGGAGAVAMQAARPSVSMAPAVPVAIHSLSSSGIVTVKGRVAEIYGNKFIMTDSSGRALIDTGREGEGGGLVTTGEDVMVQGRFERGFVHAAYLVGPDAKIVALGPLDGPPPPGGPGHHGPRFGPDDGPGGPPSPPGAGPAADQAPPPPPPLAGLNDSAPPAPTVAASKLPTPSPTPASPATATN